MLMQDRANDSDDDDTIQIQKQKQTMFHILIEVSHYGFILLQEFRFYDFLIIHHNIIGRQ